MNREKLRIAEAHFLQSYPGGFADPALESVGKKHNMSRATNFAKAVFAKKSFDEPNEFLDSLVKLVSRSSMVSLFEKPKFRDMVKDLNSEDREVLVESYKKLFHGNQKKGFEEVVEILAWRKMAKWSLMTIGLVYYRPQKEVFVKPTTAKAVVQKLELDLTYKPRPSWEFYSGYRDAILEMKSVVNPSLAPNNAALTGFLMMTL
ncbi:MAG: hypothetical protein JJ934_04620 [Pseudomonadales bacterium]|nr:hypothetical protein [Pseudomonadales bacterium]MBO6565522.1 hypothetical protein [Pseudomonadales bacterium]MBO6597032.1 hypothetical protein [Pseudomonadales bacterium]MBO6656153.1 hypothetical protein [Pseudomonadales bacterium]MBO6703674.1 hypothetical protein [Pseudomonadales bacterium]